MQPTEQKEQQFDSTARIVTTMRTEAEGRVEVAMTWPADELWAKRAKTRKVLTRVLGRGQNEADVEPGDSDLVVYNATRTEGSPDLTAAEATLLVSKLAYTSVIDTELGQSEAVVNLEVMKGIKVTHRLKIPTAKQAKECSRLMDRFVGLPHNVFSNTVNLQATATMWGQLAATTENYSGDVPIIHKDAVIRELFQALEREIGEGPDEGF